MRVIPVLDLKGGVAVRARAGERDAYAPLAPSRPEAVVGGFLALHPFQTIYLADLDAIERRGDNRATIEALCAAFPKLSFRVDAGATTNSSSSWRDVVGAESLDPTAPSPDFSHSGAVLSLDFRGADFLGPASLLASQQLWPQCVIVMTLARVGMSEGPDFARIAEIKTRAPTRDVFAAGGVRDARDLQRLRDMGVAGALVATALREGRIGACELSA